MSILDRMRIAIRAQRYRISSHANEEMADDLLVAADIENIILSGRIARKLTDDLRGSRYVVLGKTADRRQAYVVCRFWSDEVLLIITAYVEREGEDNGS
jgi:hypothetical protein